MIRAITAKQARRLAETATVLPDIDSDICDRVTNAAAKGRLSLTLDRGLVCLREMEWLLLNGYELWDDRAGNGRILISWENASV